VRPARLGAIQRIGGEIEQEARRELERRGIDM
jgi:hypothetical protein